MAAKRAAKRGATGRQVAERLGVSDRYVRELSARGVIPARTPAGWDLEAVDQAYRAHLRAVAGGRAIAGEPLPSGTPGASGASSLKAEQARLAKEKADELAMRNAVTRGDLVTKAAVRNAVIGAWAHVRARLLTLPTKGAPMLLGIDALPAMQAALTELLRDALDELAATRSVPVGLEAVHDPAGLVGDLEAAAAPDGQPVGRPRARAQQRSKRRARKMAD